mgnify:CR=1 FL=1
MRLLRKNGIAMIMAIAVIVVVGTIMALSLSMTTKTTKRNLDIYLYEQIEMLSDSAREYAMYKIDNNATQCAYSNFSILGQDTLYDINIGIRYVTATGCPAGNDFTNDLDPALLNDVAVIDVTVSVDKTESQTTEDIRFHKRYIENIKP